MKKPLLLTLGLMLFITPIVANQAFAGISECPPGSTLPFPECLRQPVGGLVSPLPESELYGELMKQYSLWLIPTLSAIGVGIFVIKRKF